MILHEEANKLRIYIYIYIYKHPHTRIYIYIHIHTHKYIYIYIYIYIYVTLSARIFLTLSCHQFLSSIAFGRSSGLHPISVQSCCMLVRAGCPACARRCEGVLRITSLTSYSLLLQQCSTCLVPHIYIYIYVCVSKIKIKK